MQYSVKDSMSNSLRGIPEQYDIALRPPYDDTLENKKYEYTFH